MAIFTAAEMADLRSLQQSSLTQACTIVTDAEVSDGAGGQTTTETTVATENCRVSPMPLARAEAVLGDRFRDTIPYQIALKHDTAARRQHRIQVGSDVYEVVAIWEAGTYGTTTKAICIKR